MRGARRVPITMKIFLELFLILLSVVLIVLLVSQIYSIDSQAQDV